MFFSFFLVIIYFVQAPCKRSQKLGDKITALQQLVSAEAAFRHRNAAFMEDHWRCLGTL